MSRSPWWMPAIALAGVVAGAGAVAVSVSANRGPAPLATGLVGCLVGWSLIAGGLVARRLGLEVRVGNVLIAIGFAWFATFLQYAGSPPLATLGIALESVYLVGFVWLVLAFPTGRLATRIDRLLVGAAVLLATVVEWTWLLFARKPCGGCSANSLQVWDRPAVADSIQTTQRGVGLALSILTVGLVVRRWRWASRVMRRQAAPVLWAGAALLTVLAASVANDIGGAPYGDELDLAVACVLVALPIAVVVVLFRRQLDRGTVASLVVELSGDRPRLDLQQSLSRALGDPSLRIAYWLDEQQQFVERSGDPIAIDAEAGSAVTPIERDGRTIAALVHDPALRQRPELVDSVRAALALRLDNERLEADLRTRARQLQESRARLADVADRERRRLEHDLHDGAQQRLVSASMTLGLAQARDRTGQPVGDLIGDAQSQLEQALGELRQLSHGLLPPLLRERGLAAALHDLAKRTPVPTTVSIAPQLPPIAANVAAALYFVASEGVANVVKHADATHVNLALDLFDGGVRLRVDDDGCGGADPAGAGLRGLADRVGALGGQLVVSGRTPSGTRVEAQVP